MSEAVRPEGPDLSRREFVKTVGAAVLTSTVGTPVAPAETAVARFYRSLKRDQKASLCFPHDHPLRSVVRPNWAIVRPTIRDLTGEQQSLCEEVFKTLCSDDGRDRFLRQMGEDYGGFGSYHVAVFGQPGTGQPFEWVLTGRHVTLRTDGLSPVGPLFYGHATLGSHGGTRRAGNVWRYQAERADALFQTLDDTQTARALTCRAESGLGVGSLDGQQRRMVRDLLGGLFLPFRYPDSDSVVSCLCDRGGVDSLRLTCGRQDPSPDVWNLQGPDFSWYFHGSPHVHAWLTVSKSFTKLRV